MALRLEVAWRKHAHELRLSLGRRIVGLRLLLEKLRWRLLILLLLLLGSDAQGLLLLLLGLLLLVRLLLIRSTLRSGGYMSLVLQWRHAWN